MKEVKQPNKKGVLYFYAIALALILVANMLLPALIAPRTETVNYN